MKLRSVMSFLTHRAVEALVVVLVILFLPNIPPNAKFSTPFKVPPPLPFEGKLALNEKLNNVEIWHKSELTGPEGLAVYNNELYTTVHGGDVVKLTGNHITPIVKFGKPCKGIYQEKICGRPLGLDFAKDGTLYVADAYYGLFKVNIKTGEKVRLVSPDEEINGKKPKLFNSVAVASNGDVYWSDSSTEFELQDGLFDVFADGTGRLIHYDAAKKKNTVLIDELKFANGVRLADDESFVLVNDLGRSRVLRYYLKGPNKGTYDVFIDRLPGVPDNIGSDGQGGFLFPLVIAVDADHPYLPQVLGPFPLARKFIARLMGLVEFGFKLVERIYPNEYTERGVHFMGHFTSFTGLITPKRVTILRVSKSGEILDSLHALNGKISGICDAIIFKDTLYLGSPFNDYIGRIKLSEIGWEHLAEKQKSTAPPTTTEKPRPSTTKQTQVPTTQAPPTTKQTQAPTTQPPPTTKPTQAPTTKTPPPTKQTQAPTTQAPPTTKQTQAPTTQTPPTAKQTEAPPVKQARAGQEPPVAQKTTKPTQATVKTGDASAAQPVKESQKTVPVKDNPK